MALPHPNSAVTRVYRTRGGALLSRLQRQAARPVVARACTAAGAHCLLVPGGGTPPGNLPWAPHAAVWEAVAAIA